MVIGLGIPEVQGEIKERAGGIPQELVTPEVWIALEEPDPRAIGPIDVFKPPSTSRLDFELPEDYKHRCPIFCSRLAAFQDNFKGEDWCAGRL